MRKTRNITAIILSVLMLTAALGGCSGDKSAETSTPAASTAVSAAPVQGGELTVGIAQDIDDSIDPHKMVSAGTREVLFNVFEGLLKPDTNGDMQPAVASDCKINDTGDVFTFTLRDGVQFHNGSAVTVNDVVYSLKRAAGLDTGTPLVTGFDEIKSVEAPDDKTVVVTLTKPDIEFKSMLTAAIIPDGNDPTKETIGTGPVKFVSRAPQQNVVIEKFDGYWGTPAYVDKVTYKIIDNAETLVMSLKSGSVDLVAHLTSAQVKELGSDYTVVDGTMNLVQALYLNNKVAPLDNVKVRQALCYAVDRQGIMDMLADGKGVAVGSSMYPAFKKYYRADLADTYKTDIEKAKQLLTEAGYPDGFALDVTVPSNYKPHVDTAEIIAQQLKQIGVTVNIKNVDWGTWLSDVYSGRNFQSTVIGVDAASLTARAMLERFVSDSGSNFTNFNDPEYDKLYAEAASCTDEAQQIELYKQLQEILTKDAANVYIQDMCDYVAMGKGVQGYEFYPLYVMDMSKVYFTNKTAA